jgi:hypothetical protein
MAPLPDDEQFAAIRNVAFFDNAQNKMQSILAAMASTGFDVEGEVRAEVDGVPVSFRQLNDEDAEFRAGHGVGASEDAEWFYSWHIPVAWVMPAGG